MLKDRLFARFADTAQLQKHRCLLYTAYLVVVWVHDRKEKNKCLKIDKLPKNDF